MLAKTYGAAVQGIDALIVTVEVNVASGSKLYMVGLPDNAVKESHERILSALQNSGLSVPQKKTVINLAPADLKRRDPPTTSPLPSACWPHRKWSSWMD